MSDEVEEETGEEVEPTVDPGTETEPETGSETGTEAGEEETGHQLTVEDLQKEIPPQDYETITLGEETVAVRALLKAKLAVAGMVLSTGNKYDEENEVCREATLKYALYELFAFVGQENRAREKLEDCELLIETYFGSIRKKTDADSSSGSAVGVVHGGRKSPMDRRRY